MRTNGPIAVTETSHPFSSMQFARKVIDVSDYDFVEEEYFISGEANVYDINEENQAVLYEQNLPYCTRILVRRPKSAEDFTGICYVDIMNASNGYDIEDLWRRVYLHVMENKHMYVGVTTKPINVLSLKNFDYPRYKDLDWSSSQRVPQPTVALKGTGSIPGTEEGLVWDILYQVAKEIRTNPQSFCGDLKPEYLYLSGQSQSGMYLNTYVNYMHPYYEKQGVGNVYDGYLSLASGGIVRELRQKDSVKTPFSTRPAFETEVSTPVISINTENDYALFGAMGYGVTHTVNADSATNKRRYYDMAGSAHTDAASPLVPTNEEIVKTKCPPRILDGEYDYRLNDLPFDYYINAMLDNLHRWAKDGIAPAIIEPLETDADGEIVRDEHGNAKGGIRSPFLEVPKARYQGSYAPGATNGTMEFFSEEKMQELYGSEEAYISQFEEYANRQVEENLLTPADKDRCLNWAKTVKE